MAFSSQRAGGGVRRKELTGIVIQLDGIRVDGVVIPSKLLDMSPAIVRQHGAIG
jgi:hypothetical protein